MAVLTTAQREKVRHRFSKRNTEPLNSTVDELLTAVGGLDDELEVQAANLNSGIPEPARTDMTASHKALMLAFIAHERAVV